jgi:hypothetical protein
VPTIPFLGKEGPFLADDIDRLSPEIGGFIGYLI